MNAPFPARLPFEMFDRVCDINLPTVDPRIFQRSVHDLAGRPHERLAGDVFVIARLLAYQHDRRMFRPFTKNSLGRPFVKRTRRVAEKIGMTPDGETIFRGFPTIVFAISREIWWAKSGV
jgi:hypothetical protein